MNAHQFRAIASLLLLCYLTSLANPTQAQPITPAADGTGTLVTPEGPQYNIEGGQLSKDGANLFHSFEQFGLDTGQVANFLSNPDIQNILGRITGGDASIINGLIQLTGGNSNLYLMNPAGILFGPNAQLNVPADFFATTATGIGFSQGNWFNSVGDNQWSNLVGNPSQFAFSTLQPGALVNLGNLTLEPGNNLTLLGGTVLNTGTLSAPGGNITIAAVPGESLVRISQENHLLSLDIQTGISDPSIPTPQSLPELLTGSGVTHANQVTINADGSIQLSGSGLNIDTQTGDNIASGNIAATEGQIAVLGDRVAVINADINTSGNKGGGTVLIGGDYQGNGTIPNALQTIISPNTTIQADGIETGDGGRVIIWADQTTRFFGNISAQGGRESGDGGFVEVSGLEFLDFQGQVNTFAPNGNLGTLLLDPTNIEVVPPGTEDTDDLNHVDAFAKPDQGDGETKLDVTAINDATANVILQATNDITFSAAIDNPNLGVGLRADAGNDIRVNANINLKGGNIELNADGGIAITNDVIINTGGGNFTATGTGSATSIRGITVDGGTINAAGGNIYLTGRGLDGVNQGRGILLANGSSVETTGDGTIILEGTGGNGTDGNHGIFVDNGTSISANGDITLIGTGGDATGTNNSGVRIQVGSRVESTGGAVAITGTGGTGTDPSVGISFANTSSILGNGDITLTGTGGGDGTGGNNRGISIENNSRVESTGGAVAITGIGGTGGDFNHGIFVTNTSRILGNGDITLTGTGGGTGQFNRGVTLEGGSIVESTGGAVAITGTGGAGTNANIGISVVNTSSILGNGDITLTGTGDGTGEQNRGIQLQNGSNIESTGTGSITFEGMGATGAEGIWVLDSFINYTETGSGDVILRSNNMRLTGESRITTQSTLTLEPIALGDDISINNTIAPYRLTTEELRMFDVGSGTLTLGSETIGNIYLGSLDESIDLRDVNYDLTLKTDQGIYVQGDLITNTQNLILDGGVNLLNPATFTTDSGNITLNQTLDGNSDFTLNVGSGNLAIEGDVGSQTELGNLTILNANTVTTQSINAASLTQSAGTGSTIFNGEIVTTGANGINLTTNQIIFNAPITTTGGGGVTLNNTEILNLAAPFNLEGVFQQTGVGSVILNSEITTTDHNIEFTAPVTLTGEASLNPGTGGLVFGSSLDAGNNPLTLTAGQIEFNGPVTGSNTLTLQPATTTQNMTLGDDNFNAESLHLTPTELEYIQDGFTAITLGRPDSSGTLSIVSPLTFLDPVAIEAGSGIIAVNGTIMGSDNAGITLNAATIQLNSDINTDHHDIALTGNVILGNDITLNTNNEGGDITVVGNMDGDASLTLDAGTGNITLNGAVGSQTPLGNLTILNANNVTTQSINAESLTQIAGTGNTIFNGEIVTTGPNGINLTTNQMTFNAPTTTIEGGGVILNNTENLEITAPFNLTGAFQQIGTGAVTLGSDITTANNNIEFTAPVTLNAEASLNPGTGGLVFGSSLDAGNHPLTLTAGQMEFNGPVTGSNTLALQPATPTQNMALGNSENRGSLNLTRAELERLDGFSSITLGRSDSSATISVGDSLTFKTPTTLEAGSGIIAVNEQITGSNNASLALNAATIQLNSDINTDHNDIALTGNVILGNDITLNTNNEGGDITVVGNIDSNPDNPPLSNLTLNAGTGAVNLRGNLGETTPLQSLTVTSNRGTIHGNVTTDGGDITFNSAIALAEHLQLSTGSGSGNITFAGTLESQTNLGQNLTLSAGTGNVTFNRAVGSLQPLGNLAILNAGNINALDAISAASFRALSSGTITLDGNLTTTAAPGVEIQSTNLLTVTDITTNGQPLTLESQTESVITGNLDTSSPTTGGAITLTSPAGEITTGNLTASGVTQGGNITVMAEIAITAEEIDSSATTGNAGNVFLDPIGDIQVSWINAQGGTNGRGGDVFIETTGGFFRAMRSFASEYSPTGFASISTAGGTGGGSITLKHEGGDLGGPIQEFEIGNPELNGTLDVILTGTSILEKGEIFPRSITRGNITIATDDGVDPLPEEIQDPIVPNEPLLPEELAAEPAAEPEAEPAPANTPASGPVMIPQGLILPETLPPGEIASEPATEDLSTPEPGLTPEPVETPEISPSPAVNDALAQPEPIQNPTITPASEMTADPILTGSPSPTLPLFSSSEPEPVVTVDIPTEIALEAPPINPVNTLPDASIERSLRSGEVSQNYEHSGHLSPDNLELDAEVTTLEKAFSQEFMAYLKHPANLDLLSVNDIRQVLRETEEVTEIKTAVIYIVFGRTELNENAALICPNADREEDWRGDREEDWQGDRLLEEELGWPCDRHPDDPVEVTMVTGVGKPLKLQIPEANRERVEQLAGELRTQVTDLRRLFTDSYLDSAQELHRLLIAPIESQLQERGIENLVFIPDAGLRTLPFAALHDGKQFLVENYSLSLMPSFSLTQPRYTDLKTERVLAMGSTQFDNLPPLPAVSVELKNIICKNQLMQDNCWPGEVFLNEAFTFNTLTQRGNSGDFRIVHLATHADFQPGNPENSFIQLWDKRVEFPQMKELQWYNPEVELLVLSSCRTAVGDEQAELGFAGLALQSGVKSAIASLWYVSDEATLGLMSELYQKLRSAPIRSEGLRRAQLQLLRGEVRFENGELMGSNGAIALPKELSHLTAMDLSHPYYWAGFTAIGNPW